MWLAIAMCSYCCKFVRCAYSRCLVHLCLRLVNCVFSFQKGVVLAIQGLSFLGFKRPCSQELKGVVKVVQGLALLGFKMSHFHFLFHPRFSLLFCWSHIVCRTPCVERVNFILFYSFSPGLHNLVWL